jgi:excisionase family DNA binding protein
MERSKAVLKSGVLEARPVPVLLTVNETAAALRCSTATVYRHVTDGQLASLRIGGLIRIPVAELDRKATA